MKLFRFHKHPFLIYMLKPVNLKIMNIECILDRNLNEDGWITLVIWLYDGQTFSNLKAKKFIQYVIVEGFLDGLDYNKIRCEVVNRSKIKPIKWVLKYME